MGDRCGRPPTTAGASSTKASSNPSISASPICPPAAAGAGAGASAATAAANAAITAAAGAEAAGAAAGAASPQESRGTEAGRTTATDCFAIGRAAAVGFATAGAGAGAATAGRAVAGAAAATATGRDPGAELGRRTPAAAAAAATSIRFPTSGSLLVLPPAPSFFDGSGTGGTVLPSRDLESVAASFPATAGAAAEATLLAAPAPCDGPAVGLDSGASLPVSRCCCCVCCFPNGFASRERGSRLDGPGDGSLPVPLPGLGPLDGAAGLESARRAVGVADRVPVAATAAEPGSCAGAAGGLLALVAPTPLAAEGTLGPEGIVPGEPTRSRWTAQRQCSLRAHSHTPAKMALASRLYNPRLFRPRPHKENNERERVQGVEAERVEYGCTDVACRL